jgi:hypothetical protein
MREILKILWRNKMLEASLVLWPDLQMRMMSLLFWIFFSKVSCYEVYRSSSLSWMRMAFLGTPVLFH